MVVLSAKLLCMNSRPNWPVALKISNIERV